MSAFMAEHSTRAEMTEKCVLPQVVIDGKVLRGTDRRSPVVQASQMLVSDGPFPDLPEQQAHIVDKGHGRLESRRIRISNALTDYLKPGWPDVAQVFQIQRHTARGARHSTELAYGFTSLSAAAASPQQVLQAVRLHWQIENVLHYRRDVTLGEDACLVSQGQTPRILALLNNAVLFSSTIPQTGHTPLPKFVNSRHSLNWRLLLSSILPDF